jgi:hypothetical protein
MMIGRRLSTPVQRPKRCSRLTSAKYLYPESESLSLESGKRLNFSDEFLRSVAISLKSPQQKPHGLPVGLMPVDIFHYTYAVFHSPGYRSRYAEFLKTDFPRLPAVLSARPGRVKAVVDVNIDRAQPGVQKSSAFADKFEEIWDLVRTEAILAQRVADARAHSEIQIART